MELRWRYVLLIPVLLLISCEPATREAASSAEYADTVLTGGNIITMVPGSPRAQALAIKGDKIHLVGTDAQVGKLAGEGTKIIQLNGKTVVPGMIDAHCHVLGYGNSLRSLNLVGTKSLDEILEMVKEKSKQCDPGEWILGRGWDQNDWANKKFPTNDRLNEVSPYNPVCLTRICGHAVFVNKKAMNLARITKNTPDIPGGKIVRNPETGEPTGVFVDNAIGLVTMNIPGLTFSQKRECIRLAIEDCLKAGLTGLHDANTGEDEIRIYKELAKKGQLGLRVYVMISGGSSYWLNNGPETGLEGGFLTLRAIKLFSDGALGSRGAALLAPYSDEPGNSGLLIMQESEIFKTTCEALKRGFQVCTHAIGDRANRTVLNGYQKALKTVPVEDHRLRIEHAQVLHPDDVPRFSKLCIIPSMQPTHCTSDMYWAADRLGTDRVKGAYAWRSLLGTGVRIPGGSDFPVESNKPLWGIYAAITRQDHKGFPQGGWHPQQRMTFDEALRSFTIDAAYAAFEENIKGSLETGKLADLVVLDRDISKIEPKEILKTEIEMTIVGGKAIYNRNE